MYLLQLGWPIADADDYHSAANKQKMIDGIPLTDEASTATKLLSVSQFMCSVIILPFLQMWLWKNFWLYLVNFSTANTD